jgi:hypothetical protein
MRNPGVKRDGRSCAIAFFLVITMLWCGGCSPQAEKGSQGARGTTITVAARSPIGEVTKPPLHFFWKCSATDKTYFIRIVDPQNRTIYSQSTRDDHIAVPERIKDALAKLGSFTWQVEVRTLSGETLGKSEPVAVTIQTTTQNSE